MEWSNERVLQLIAEYEARPVLWNPKDWCYKNKIKKIKAWEEIAIKFNVSPIEVERKFRILLVQYRREKSKIMKMVAVGHDLAELEATAWYAYRSFNFLHLRSKSSHISDGLDVDNTKNFNDTEYEEIKIEPASDDYLISSDNYVEDFLESNMEEVSDAKRRKLRTEPNNLRAPSKVDATDDMDLFASYIASEIKSLRQPQIKRKLKRNILKALIEASEEDEIVQVQ